MFSFEILEDSSLKFSIFNLTVLFAGAKKSRGLLSYGNIKFLNQTHSSNIVNFSCFSDQLDGDGWLIQNDRLIESSMIPAMRTSDCMPVVLVNAGFSCLLHVGWRGLKNEIVDKALSLIQPSVAILGPCARACCYEVKEDILEIFGPVAVYRKVQNKYMLDLPAMMFNKLKNIPLLDFNLCTICNFNFFSYRRKDRGSNLTLVLPSKIKV